MDSILQTILTEIRGLREQVSRPSNVPSLTAAEPPMLYVTFAERTNGDRKPYEMELTGQFLGSYPLTDVRTAILLVLLADLTDRQREGPGFSDRVSLIARTLATLSGGESSPRAIQAAISRMGDFFTKDRPFDTPAGKIQFARNECRLLIPPGSLKSLDIRITAIGPKLQRCLATDLAIPPLERVRQQRVQFVTGGPDGFDRLFLDFFQHGHPVEERSFYFKPSIVTYPPVLLDALGTSDHDTKRKKVIEEGFAAGRCKFVEVLNRHTLEDMIRLDRAGHLKLYGPRVKPEMVLSHFKELQRFVTKYHPAYELVLTNVPLPFWLCTFVLGRRPEEYYTVFFRHLIQEHDPEVDCFAICDRDVTTRVNSTLFDPLRMNSSQALRAPEMVVAELARWADKLERDGPLRLA